MLADEEPGTIDLGLVSFDSAIYGCYTADKVLSASMDIEVSE